MDFNPNLYGSSFADVYDSWYCHHDPSELVSFVRARASKGSRLLELGVGTGRAALALDAAGFEVWGVDVSEEMLAVVEQKRGAENLTLSCGDVSDVNAFPAQQFDVVVACFNLSFNLADAPAQQRCLAASREALAPDGVLIVETFVPASPASRRTDLVTKTVNEHGAILISTETDPRSQVINGCHIELSAGGQRVRPWRVRYSFPDEIDQLAEKAGLARIETYSSFAEDGFDPQSSANRVAVYERS